MSMRETARTTHSPPTPCHPPPVLWAKLWMQIIDRRDEMLHAQVGATTSNDTRPKCNDGGLIVGGPWVAQVAQVALF